jgi:queuine tRNA-ribosyltransferase
VAIDTSLGENAMRPTSFPLELVAVDSTTAARRTRFTLPHGVVETPTFMPVGTQGSVKGLTIDQLSATGSQMILGNTYHLSLRPGSKRIARLGGLHEFMGWKGPILTDSGGFQIFSLAHRLDINEQSAKFRSHIDGSLVELAPEDSIRIQEDLGSDVVMVLDHVIGLPAPLEKIQDAMARSIRWAKRSLDAATRTDQAKFAIVQGGLDSELRRQCAAELISIGFDGYAVGGLSVGEPPAEMYRVLDHVCPVLPANRPRYLMGVGTPIDLLEGVARGIDLFDCVMPTRNGRNGMAFTAQGSIRIRNQKHADDISPIESDCPCPACRHSKAYIRHLFMAKEMLGPTLLSIHNITFYQRLMSQARQHIEAGTFGEFLCHQRLVLGPSDNSPSPS